MAKKYNIFLFVIVLGLLFSNATIYPEAKKKTPDVGAESALLIEAKTGKVLYEKNANSKIYPASTTKILTALLAIEKLDMKKHVIIPSNMGPADGSAMYLLPGERFTVKELLQGLMVKSANDAAVILAKEISGDVNTFSKLMNEKAKELGCKNTHFINPNGLHEDDHYTTAADMALIAREAMKSELFRELVSTVRVTFDETHQTPEKRYFLNTNRFLWDDSKIIIDNEYIPIHYSVVNGIKTGYTPEAKNCLVSSGKKNGIELIALVYRAEGFEMYRDSRLILDYGFDNYISKTLIKKGQVFGRHEIQHTVPGFVSYYTQDEYTAVCDKNDDIQVATDIVLDDFELPILKDQKIGELKVKFDNESLSLPLYATNNLESIFTIKYFQEWIIANKIIVSAILLCFFILIGIIIIIFRLSSNRRRKRKKYLKKYNNLY